MSGTTGPSSPASDDRPYDGPGDGLHSLPDGGPGAGGADGRLVVVSGPDGAAAEQLARAMADRLGRALVADGSTLAGMVVGAAEPPAAAAGEPGADRLDQMRDRLLRYCGELALAESYRRAGYDVLIVEDLADERLDDFRDLADPDPVHLVVLDVANTAGPGLRLRADTGADLQTLAGLAVESLPQAVLPAE